MIYKIIKLQAVLTFSMIITIRSGDMVDQVKDYDEHYSIRMRTMLQDQVADGVDLGLEDHLPSVQLLSLCVLMVAEMKILTIMMTMGVEVIIKIIMITMKMMTIIVSLMVSKK